MTLTLTAEDSMTLEEEKFLLEVATRSKKPAMMQSIIMAAISGVKLHAEEVRAHAVDMEVVANMAMENRLFKGNERFIADKLDKWRHMNGLNWNQHVLKLRQKAIDKEKPI